MTAMVAFVDDSEQEVDQRLVNGLGEAAPARLQAYGGSRLPPF